MLPAWRTATASSGKNWRVVALMVVIEVEVDAFVAELLETKKEKMMMMMMMTSTTIIVETTKR